MPRQEHMIVMNEPRNLERWKPVVGYEGLYEVSSYGRVFSLRTKRILRTWRHYRAGVRLTLTKDGVRKMNQVHRLVYSAFVGPIPDGMIVRHLNDDADDNRVENLAIGTRDDNVRDMLKISGHYKGKTVECPRGHPLVEGNLVIGQLKRGHRACLACDRAGVQFRRRPELGPLQELSDGYFQKLIEHGAISDAVGLSWNRA